ncbi:MAG TPA: hypothetical protein VHA11_06355 [Bryobacteraceae bacterium]|nr:hypothetical protein [Bryobacteraceae bacterium]
MRHTVIAGLVLAFSLSAFAQRHGGPPPNFVRPVAPTRPFNNGFGRFAYPGTGVPSGRNTVTFPFNTGPTTFVERMGAMTSGVGYTGVSGGHRGFGYGRRGGAAAAFPIVYPVPVYVGGEYYSDPSYYQGQPQQQTPNITIVMPPQNTPPVTVNQYAQDGDREDETSSGGSIHTYQAPSAERSGPSDDAVVFYVALKDSSVYTALAYWVEDSTLHYITSQGKHNQVSLDLVDRETSAKLNEGRKVEFRLPAR